MPKKNIWRIDDLGNRWCKLGDNLTLTYHLGDELTLTPPHCGIIVAGTNPDVWLIYRELHAGFTEDGAREAAMEAARAFRDDDLNWAIVTAPINKPRKRKPRRA